MTRTSPGTRGFLHFTLSTPPKRKSCPGSASGGCQRVTLPPDCTSARKHLERNNASELRHRLDLHDSRHDRTVREVTGELRLVGRDALHSHGHLPRDELQDLVDEKEGVPEWKTGRSDHRRQKGQTEEEENEIASGQPTCEGESS
eukprot:749407-Hanusia_phi.AAC.3